MCGCLLAFSCGGRNTPSVPSGNEGPDMSGAVLSAAGGRERAELCWQGFPPEIASIVLTVDPAKGSVSIPTGGAPDGKSCIDGLGEKTWDCPVFGLCADGTTVGMDNISITVYGPRYEAALPEGGEISHVISGASAQLCLKELSHYCYYGYELKYTSAGGAPKTLLVGRQEAGSVSLHDVGSAITVRPVFKPEPSLDDLFYGPAFEIAAGSSSADFPRNETVDGYRGIWFDLGQASDYGSKYSGGLGTYTMKHIPMAIYSPVVDKTFFVYGGTPSEDRKYLLCMIGCYDHATGMLQKPRIVMDKGTLGVADPHDDPTVQIDRDGYIWVFVAGRSNKRNGVRYRSRIPYDITSFEYINEDIMAYPQVMYHPDKGFFLFYTRYDGTRQLFWRTSADGVNWTDYKQLASIKEGSEKNSGHYQISNICGTKLCTAFNRHINGNVDTRTNIYYLQSTDWGASWTTADGTPVKVPVTERYSNCLVRDYQVTDETHNCYIKDLNFDSAGNPVILYLTSRNHTTGPEGGTRTWHVIHWTGSTWEESVITTSTHCYDSGSLWVEGDDWVVIAPTDPGPQYWGAGGEVVRWRSSDRGRTWVKEAVLTSGSTNNQTYMRRPWNARDGFYCFWADGNPDKLTRSNLYFCTKDGTVYRMPYQMDSEWAQPERI
ncbi:MAG: BNR-4 repeat-containing protein [Bacteroidales bacterium]|nr:BNR-4 repeat-containing protein [Bacteroidales bacterium]